jgi:hypothetical protein
VARVIVNSCVWEFSESGGGLFDGVTVLVGGSFKDVGQELGSVEEPPPLAGARISLELEFHGEQRGAAAAPLGVLRPAVPEERIERLVGFLLVVSAIQLSWIIVLAFGCLFGEFVQDVRCLVHATARCSRILGKTSASAFQKPSAPSPTASFGSVVSPRRFTSSTRSHYD